ERAKETEETDEQSTNVEAGEIVPWVRGDRNFRERQRPTARGPRHGGCDNYGSDLSRPWPRDRGNGESPAPNAEDNDWAGRLLRASQPQGQTGHGLHSRRENHRDAKRRRQRVRARRGLVREQRDQSPRRKQGDDTGDLHRGGYL